MKLSTSLILPSNLNPNLTSLTWELKGAFLYKGSLKSQASYAIIFCNHKDYIKDGINNFIKSCSICGKVVHKQFLAEPYVNSENLDFQKPRM